MKGHASHLLDELCTAKAIASGNHACPSISEQKSFSTKQFHQPSPAPKFIKSKYKTTPCIYVFNDIQCPYGDRCCYAHSAKELRQNDCTSPSPEEKNDRYKAVMCNLIQMGKRCPYGDRCHFAHHRLEQRNVANPEVEKRRKLAHFYSKRWEYPASYLKKLERQRMEEGRNPRA